MKQRKTDKQSKKDRFLWADITRIIAIFFVVQSHSLYISSKSSEIVAFISFILLHLEKICVPLFVMLSGSLLLKKEEGLVVFAKKRVLKVLVPWVLWTGIYMWYRLTYSPAQNSFVTEFFHNTYSPVVQWFHFFVHTFITILWFLPVIVALYLLTPLLKIIIKRVPTYFAGILILLWFILISVIPYLTNKTVYFTYELTMRTIMQYVGYYFLGYYLIWKKHWKFIFYLLPLPIIIGLFPELFSAFPIDRQYIQGFSANYMTPGIIMASIASFLFLFYIFRSVKIKNAINSKTQKIILALSKASLGVYIIHGVVIDQMRYVLYPQFDNFNALIFYPLLIFAISAIIVIVIQQIPILRRAIP